MFTETSNWVGLVLANGRYRVVAKLGEGGMGFVYRARDVHLDNQDVVIKVPRLSMLEDPEFAGRFAREIRSLVRLTHPHIVRVSDAGEHEGVPFAVMQYLSGGSLRDRQQTDPDGHRLALPPEELHAWLPDVATALDFIHERHYIHRDIKPDNILFDDHGHVYLSDFGIAKVLADNAAQKPTTVHTGTGKVLGTPQYMAPELIMGERCDGRIDQYALAVTVYELLSGRLPADGPTLGAILVQQTTKIPVPLAKLVPTITESLSRAVQKALSRDPNERYLNCTAFAQVVLEGVAKTAAAPGRRASSASHPRAVLEGVTSAYKVSCPSCRKMLVLRHASQGKRVRCGSCGEVFQAPAVSKTARTNSAPAVSETGRVEQARLDTPTAVRSEPLMLPDANMKSAGSFEPLLGDTSDELQSSESKKPSRYLVLAISLAAGLGLLGVLTVLLMGRKADAVSAKLDQPAKKSNTSNSTHKDDQKDERTPKRPSLPPAPAPPQRPLGPPLSPENPSSNRPSPPKENRDPRLAEHAKPQELPDEDIFLPPNGPGNPALPEGPKPESPLSEIPGGAREPQLAGPDGGLKRKMEKYIRKEYTGRSPKIDDWHPPRRATNGKKEGWLYRAEFSILNANQRQQLWERRKLNYYLFVVNDSILDKQVTSGGWETVKDFKFLDAP